MASSVLGEELQSPPTDGITSLRFCGDSDLLLASSWDGSVRVYDAVQNQPRYTSAHGAPVLDATFENEGVLYSGGLDHAVKRYGVVAGQEAVLGRHDAPVKCVEWLPSRRVLASAGWDASLRLWDPRGPGGCVAAVALPGKAYSMATTDSRLVVATSGRHVDIYDLRSIEGGKPEQRRESSLKFQTRCVRCFPDGAGYALSSVEGRVAMEFFDLDEATQARKYAFKCHRRTEEGRDVVYPVNAISFNPAWGTFATGGCDGVVSIWDGANKKRLHQVAAYPTSVAALAFNAAGSLLAVAASYTYEQGERQHPADAVFVRRMAESEVRPKARAQAA